MIGKTNCSASSEVIYEQIVNYKMLYYAGDECISETGGYDTYTDASIACNCNTEKKATSVAMHGTLDGADYYPTGIKSKNIIDLSGYNKIMLKGTSRRLYYGYDYGLKCSLSNMNDLLFYAGRMDYTNQWWCDNLMLLNKKDILKFFTWGTEAELFYALVTKPDDWNTLCAKANITAPASIDTLLSNATTVGKILSSRDAVIYMISHCTGDFMASAVLSSTFLAALNNSVYKTVIQANPHWSKFLAMVS